MLHYGAVLVFFYKWVGLPTSHGKERRKEYKNECISTWSQKNEIFFVMCCHAAVML